MTSSSRLADALQRTFAAVLGLTTIGVGVAVGTTMLQRFAFHRCALSSPLATCRLAKLATHYQVPRIRPAAR